MPSLAPVRPWIFILVAATATIAHAQDKQKARELWRRGTQHYNLGEFAEALDSFKAAYRESEDPTFLYNLGQCARQLGQRREALQFFRAYLRELPNAPNAEQVLGFIAKLERELPAEAEPPTTSATTTTTTSAPTTSAPTGAPAASAPAASGPAATSSAPALVATPADRETRRPVYKRWYVWTAVAVVVAAGVGVTLGLTLGRAHDPTAATSEGTFMPFAGH